MNQQNKSFAVLTLLFFMWGFITVMNDLLINNFKQIFQLTSFQAAFVQFAFFMAYFIISLTYTIWSFQTGKDPINKLGYKNGMMISLVICAAGCFTFYPAAIIESYGLFLSALFILASGVTLLQICANPYAAIMGPEETASSRLNLAQGLNSLGTTIGPIIGSILIYNVFSSGDATASSVSLSYICYGTLFILAAITLYLSKMPSFSSGVQEKVPLPDVLQKSVILGVLAIFFYVGAEVSVGSFLIPYINHLNLQGIGEQEANYLISYYWGGAMIGRLMGAISMNSLMADTQKRKQMLLTLIALLLVLYIATAIKFDGRFHFHFLPLKNLWPFLLLTLLNYLAFILGKGKTAKTLFIFVFFILLFLLLTILLGGYASLWLLLGIGLFNSIIWSNIFTLTISKQGNKTSLVSSLLIMAVVGGAILPLLQGWMIDTMGMRISFLIPVMGYSYLLYFGFFHLKNEPHEK